MTEADIGDAAGFADVPAPPPAKQGGERWSWREWGPRTGPDSAADLEVTFRSLIQGVDLEPEQREWLRSRWLGRVVKLRKNADQTRQWFYWLRGTSIVAALIVPALVSLNLNGKAAFWTRVASVILSLIAAIGVSVLELFRFGPRWRLYREYCEPLVSEGWEFFELRRPYTESHRHAFTTFVGKVEDLIARYERDYIKDVIRLPGDADLSVPKGTDHGKKKLNGEEESTE